MIRYRGREMDCFMVRKGCRNGAELRVEGRYLLMHVCRDHRGEAEHLCTTEGEAPATVVELAPLGGEDVLEAVSLDPAALKRLPHIVSAE